MLLDVKEYRNQIETMLYVSKINWKLFDNKSVLITGAAGMIGSCVVDVLVYLNEVKGYHISIFALGRTASKIKKRFESVSEKPYFNILEKDISHDIELEEQIDFVIHAASNADPIMMSKYPVDTLLANVVGMNNMLKLAQKCKCEKVVYLSSGEMYGQPDETVGNGFFEDYCGYVDYKNPRSCYPSGKRAAEVLCQSYIHQYDLDISIVRPCHCYGPTMTDTDSRAVSQFIRNVVRDEDVVLKSNGELVRSHCYVVDAAYAVFYILLKGENGEAYNIADEKSKASIKELAETICKGNKSSLVFDVPTDVERQGFSKVVRAVLSSDKLEKLGWHPIFHLEDGVQSTIRILKESINLK